MTAIIHSPIIPTYVSGDPIASSGFRRTIAPIMKRTVDLDRPVDRGHDRAAVLTRGDGDRVLL
jgi:hypothetical protein